MTEEEAQREEDAELLEAAQLSARIQWLSEEIQREKAINSQLEVKLEALVRDVDMLTKNAAAMDDKMNRAAEALQSGIQSAESSVDELFEQIDDLADSYYVYKNLSTASKNVTQYTDEYFTRFKFYHELRRIALGYVVGLDQHICSDETMRKRVETIYLANTGYWLAYGLTAVMLWASDEQEAAKRALAKSLSMNYHSSSLFFLLVNLRFTRVEAARKWYLAYLERVDFENLGEEWHYLLQAYLSGVFGMDRDFNRMVYDCFANMLRQMECIHPNYGSRVVEKTIAYSTGFIHITDNEFETLRRYAPDYGEMKALLSNAERNEVLAVYIRGVLENQTLPESDMFQRIEDILYDLVSAYDEEELEVVKKKQYNEMIIKARGDLGAAQQFYNLAFPSEKKTKALEDLLFEWAFEEDPRRVNRAVKRFAMVQLRKWLVQGFTLFAESYRGQEKEKYRIAIDGWEGECDENSYQEARAELIRHYNQDRFSDILRDRFVMVCGCMVLASLALLGVTAFWFNRISLVMGVLLGVVSGFLLWRRISDLLQIRRGKREKGCELLRGTLEELGRWRELYRQEDAGNADLAAVFDNMEI